MKKLIITLSAVLAAVSCAEELAETQNPVENIEYRTVTFESIATKTTISDNGTVEWEEGDEISIYYVKSDGASIGEATAVAQTAGTTSKFTAQIPAEDNPEAYYAAYPAGSGELTVTDGSPSFLINVDASRCDGTFKSANFAAAYSTAEAASFQFKNAVGMLKFKVSRSVKRAKDASEYPINGIYMRGKTYGSALDGKISVTVENDAVSGFGDSESESNVNMRNISSEAVNSGYIYMPCTPAEWADGICVRFYSDKGAIPAVLSPDNVKVSIERGHVLPVADLTEKVVFDYYVSGEGSGDGLSASSPMSVSAMQEILNKVTVLHPTSETKMQFPCYYLNGATFNFVEGTHSIESTITIPAGSIDYEITVDGNGTALLQGSTAKVFDVNENAVIRNITIDGADVSSLTETSANGAGVTVNAKTKVVLENVTIKNCKAKSGGAVFVSYANGSDDDSLLDCVNCRFSQNTATANGSAVISSGASTGGQIRFDECVFYMNTNGTTATVYLNGAILAMFNKCSFYENTKGNSGGRDIDTQKKARLALNNCTIRNSQGGVSNGGLLITRGNTIVANSTLFGTNIGYRNLIGLGSSDENGSLVVNSVLFSQNSSKDGIVTALCLHKDFYQSLKYSMYTSCKWEGSKEGTGFTVADSYNMDSWDKVFADRATPNGPGEQPAYYALSWTWKNDYPCPTLQQVRNAINENPLGSVFLSWLDTIEGSLSTDIAGRERPANAMCPGSYQQDGVTPTSGL